VIKLLLKLPVALALVLVVLWAGLLGVAKDPGSMVSDALADLTRAFPESSERESFLGEWGVLPPGLLHLMPSLGGGGTPLARAGLLVARLHAGAVLRLLPLLLLFLAAGGVAGLASRERMRDGEGYASPTAAGVARLLSGAGIFWLGLFSLSPVPASYATIYLSGLVLCLGGALYAANLPLKL